MNGGDHIAQALKAQGVKHLFTLCGGHISPILVGCKKLGIRVIDTRHEVNAVFAADASARLTGIPGVAAVTAGPGITNSVTALRNALQAQAPLLLLGGAAPTLLKGRGALQDIDPLPIVRSCVKWAATVTHVRDIGRMVEEAFRRSMEGVPGPVFLECPVDLLYDEPLIRGWYAKGSPKGNSLTSRFTQWYVARHVRKMFAPGGGGEIIQNKPEPRAPSQSDLRHVEALLSNSHRPVLLVGSGAMLAPDWTSEIAKALGAVGVPMYLSGMARGLLGPSHELQFRHHRREALQEADLVILAGVSCDFRLEYGNHISAKATLIMVNRDERELNKNRKAETAIHADPGEFIIRLASHLNTVPERSTWFTMLREREQARDQRIEQQAMVASQGINPVALFRTLDALLPEGAVIVADGGDFVGTASYTLRPRTPLCWLDPGVFGTLGVGGGFALGAKAVRPEAEVYIIYGDGSSAYSLMEVDSMVRNGLAAIAIIGNDASWGQIARDQVEILKDDCGTRLARSDYHKVAEAFGGKGWRVETLEQFETAVKQAQEVVRSGVPCVINAILAKSEFRKGSLSM